MSTFRGTAEEHERFKNRLVEDVLGQDVRETVPMEKVMMLLWSFRDDPSVVTFMARLVTKYSGMRNVFDGIEFYLPQLAHMIIHLEVEWDDAVLERFALVVAQQSLHFALQLNWILQGALEDYCPEDIYGVPNPKYSPLFYTRCLTLKKNIERVVVYGKPRAQELQRLYEEGKITKEEMKILETADRRFFALEITTHDASADFLPVGPLDAELFIRMPNVATKEELHETPDKIDPNKANTNEWVSRYCVLEKTVLNCYFAPVGCKSSSGVSPSPKYDRASLKLDRAMSLAHATVEQPSERKLKIQTRMYNFWIKFLSAEEAKLWLRRLQEEAHSSALFSTLGGDEVIKQDMSPQQRNRYDFFHNERTFVKSLTQVAEDLRMKDRSERKALAKTMMRDVVIPPSVYLPLGKSTDLWRRVSNTLPTHTRVFNTKERCPVVMYFLSRRGETIRGTQMDPNLDVAEYMHAHFEVTEEVIMMEPVAEVTDDAGEHGGKAAVPDPTTSSPEGPEGAVVETNKPDNGAGNGHGEEAVEQDKKADSSHGNRLNVWEGEGEVEGENVGKGARVVNYLKGSMITTMPSRLRLTRLDRGKSVSIMDRQTEVQPLVPILEGTRGEKAADEFDNASVGEGTVVSVERSSIMVKDTVVLGALEEGDIDIECIDVAKTFVCGGQVWAEQSASMLEEAKKEFGQDGADQLEIAACIAKSYDDLRQEVFIMQMIHYYKSVFAQAKLPIWLKTYTILSISSSEGMIEVLTDATSLDGLKKAEGYPTEGGLRKYFEMVYGDPESKNFKAAQKNFMQSLAGYSLVSYLLGLKDRHNGNIMIDTRGHLIHIDFGFVLGMMVGNDFSLERAPFKLTKEYIDVMGGVGSDCYKEFENLFVAGFEEARKNFQIALGLVEIMMFKSNYPCFSGSRCGNGKALIRFENRLLLNVPDQDVRRKALKLVKKARRHVGTYLYDVFQKATNGYAI